MDSDLSLIMCNLARVTPGSFCFDPFVGTGSILLTCAVFGGVTMGTDIDVRVLRGKEDDKQGGKGKTSINKTFAQFGFPRPELIRSDNSLYDRHWRTDTGGELYDAIVCDPPYGIRAGAKKCGSRKLTADGAPAAVREVAEEKRSTHIAQTKNYAVSDVMADLLEVSERKRNKILEEDNNESTRVRQLLTFYPKISLLH